MRHLEKSGGLDADENEGIFLIWLKYEDSFYFHHHYIHRRRRSVKRN